MATLADLEITKLLDMKSLSESELDSFVDQLTQLVWTNFLSTRAPYLFTQEQHKHINELVNQGAPLNQITEKMESYVPSLHELLFEFAQAFKAEYLLLEYQGKIDDIDRLYSDDLSEENKAKLHSKRSKFVRAIELLRAELWDELDELFSLPSDEPQDSDPQSPQADMLPDKMIQTPTGE